MNLVVPSPCETEPYDKMWYCRLKIAISLYYRRHLARLRRRRRGRGRAYAPTSNTASHDSHEKIH